MSEEKFGAIVVGGGLAGSTAAYVLARAGVDVLVIEKGNTCGAKNMTGGKLCTHSIEKLFPDFAETAPVERKIVRERVSQLSGDGIADVTPDALAGLTESASYSVLRARLDPWLAGQAEAEGAMFVQGIRVDDLIVRDGKVCGIVAGDDEMEADVVILAEGVNALLAQKLGMKRDLAADRAAVGVKEVLSLAPEVINARFGLKDGEGMEWMFCADRQAGSYADGFIYTNKDSLSVGVELTISDISRTDKSITEMLEEFKEHPAVAPLIEGGALVEYSAHVLHRGSDTNLSKLCGDGVLIVGDAAGLVSNVGFAVRGMDLAIESGSLAAQAVLQARARGDFSAEGLSGYQKAVEAGFIASDMAVCGEYCKSNWEGW